MRDTRAVDPTNNPAASRVRSLIESFIRDYTAAIRQRIVRGARGPPSRRGRPPLLPDAGLAPRCRGCGPGHARPGVAPSGGLRVPNVVPRLAVPVRDERLPADASGNTVHTCVSQPNQAWFALQPDQRSRSDRDLPRTWVRPSVNVLGIGGRLDGSRSDANRVHHADRGCDSRLWNWRDEDGVERGPESDAGRAHY